MQIIHKIEKIPEGGYMALTQAQTKTPEWTLHEEQLCAKILKEIRNGEVKLYQLR